MLFLQQATAVSYGDTITVTVHVERDGDEESDEEEEEEEGTLARLSVLGAPLNGGAMVVEMGNGGGKGG